MLFQENISKSNLIDLMDEQSSVFEFKDKKKHSLHPSVRAENPGLAAGEAKAQSPSPEGGMHSEEPDRCVCVWHQILASKLFTSFSCGFQERSKEQFLFKSRF